jgi:hypothetical protein
MSYPVGTHPRDLSLLEATYQIGRFIQSHVTENSSDGSGKPWSNYSRYFRDGLNYLDNQTREGLVLEEYYETPSYIHTPFGRWSILGNTHGNWKKVFDAISEPLGLKLIEEGKYEAGLVNFGPYWAITKWKDLEISWPIYRERSEYIPFAKVQEIWKEFAKNKKELT